MPADPAVRAALEAAALAGMNDAERRHADVWHDGKPGPGARAEAARTIAAFLRSLQLWTLDDVRHGSFVRDLASAVEEAARG